jgi:hypothetical protein
MHPCIFFVSSRSTKQLETKFFSSTTKAAMNRPQRFRGLATDPGVQRKAPEAVIRRAGTAVGKTIGMDSYRASSAERSMQDRITEKPGTMPGFLECLPTIKHLKKKPF